MRSFIWTLCLLAWIWPATADALCGDGVLDPGEACDDGSVVAGDGCDARCAFEPQCLVAHASNPAQAFVVRVEPDGSLESVTSSPLPSTASPSPKGATTCGRFVYFARGINLVEGFEVGLDGQLSAVSGSSAGFLSELACDESAGLLFAWSAGTGSVETASFSVGATGDLTYVTQTPPFQLCAAAPGDRHPVTGEVFSSCTQSAGVGGVGSLWKIQPVSSDASGALTEEANADYLVDESPRPRDLTFTRDGGFLVIPNIGLGTLFGTPFRDCFGWFPGPVAAPPAGEPELECQAPFGDVSSSDYQAFVPRPEGGALFYFQSSDALRAGELTPTGPVSRTSTTPIHNTEKLLTAFDGQVLVSLGVSSVASYVIAPDQVTLSPTDLLPLAADAIESGVLLSCAALADSDGDGVADPIDNCLLTPNPDQQDANAGQDDDSSRDGDQSYGDACDADLDDDGVVAASDFFGVFRPCLGADTSVRPECLASDFDGDGLVAPSDFFGGLRPALGGTPGPGVTQ
ncbi:MAG: hypothetical protein QNK05_19445 [Myxococcota bacterium]|nr:hypothetical protein [Myxococcota bacterium]